MTRPKWNRESWIPYGMLACLVLCMLFACVGVAAFVALGPSLSALMTDGRPTLVPFLGPTLSLAGGHFSHDEFDFDYPVGWQTFEVFVPATWGFDYSPAYNKALEAQELGGVVQPYIALTPGVADKYHTAVRIYKRALPPDSSFGQIYEATYAQGYPKSNAVSERKTSVDGLMALEKIYQRPSGEPWYQVRETWVEKDGIVYIISCSTLPSLASSNQAAFDGILASFHFK